MAYGIWGVLVALALVLLLGLPSLAQDKKSSSSRGSRSGAAQTSMVATSPVTGDLYKVLILHPADRMDFTAIEESVRSVSGIRNVVTEYHSLRGPADPHTSEQTENPYSTESDDDCLPSSEWRHHLGWS